jgi:hypothetical protein
MRGTSKTRSLGHKDRRPGAYFRIFKSRPRNRAWGLQRHSGSGDLGDTQRNTRRTPCLGSGRKARFDIIANFVIGTPRQQPCETRPRRR